MNFALRNRVLTSRGELSGTTYGYCWAQRLLNGATWYIHQPVNVSLNVYYDYAYTLRYEGKTLDQIVAALQTDTAKVTDILTFVSNFVKLRVKVLDTYFQYSIIIIFYIFYLSNYLSS